MKTLAIIAEYNPFHKGHHYQLHKAKELSQATHTLAIMSGHFVQRGEPAIVNKWIRAKRAVEEGLDLVIELPFIFATQSAENFARGAVGILSKTSVVDLLSFGHEADHLDELYRLKDAYAAIDPEHIKKVMREGLSYPKAKEKITGYTLHQPNDTLALKYLEALDYHHSSMVPLGIKRQGSYHDDSMSPQYPSATAMRKALLEGSLHSHHPLHSMEELEMLILKNLILSPLTHEIFGVSEGIEHAIIREALRASCLDELLEAVRTPRFSRARLKRLLIHYLFQFTKQDQQDLDQAYYVRPLAFNERGREILKRMKDKLPLISNPARVQADEHILRAFEYDIKSSNLYYSLEEPRHEAQMKPLNLEDPHA